jgi:putative transposase
VKSQKELKKNQRKLSKKKKGSKNREKALLKVKKIYTKITNQRKDYLHKISKEITNQYDIICLETLNVKSMMKTDG